MAYHGQKYKIVETPLRKKSAGKGDKLLNFVDLQTRVFRTMPCKPFWRDLTLVFLEEEKRMAFEEQQIINVSSTLLNLFQKLGATC